MDWEFFQKLFVGIFYNQLILCLPTYLGFLSCAVLLLSPRWENKVKIGVLARMRRKAFSILLIFLLLSVILTSHSLYTNKEPSFATPDELTQLSLRGRDIKLSDLTREGVVIRNRAFYDCHIYGPAIIHVRNCSLIDIVLEGVTPDNGLIATSNKKVVGAILFEGCILKECTFHRISFIGSEQNINKIRASVAK